ncbi:glutaredoxin family protein [Winogradskyella luteola]|uniref:Glutaredoxin family protein n=1 Tax=Winogradskyella luteola TaxID=2828330 RepID=A0A9X1JSS9_9FLAO|nr:glutaredoxin family protein [Winogradskyella luteola]MBV7269947.1 glutaredoxin family protein [Winogradskyella luteola]
MAHPTIKLYGAQRCHKTRYYQTFFSEKGLDFIFLDVEENDNFANELRSLYGNGRLNFPTITIGNRILRNPSNKELEKWLQKLKLV